MTDTEYQAAKVRVEALAEKWQRVLGLAWWRIDYVWLRELLPTTKENADTGWCVAATCDARWQYLNARIEVSLPALADKTDRQIERTLVHELSTVW